MDLKTIVNRVLRIGVTQESLGNYLGVTRQTVAKIESGKYVKRSINLEKKLGNLQNRTDDEILKILKISSDLDEIKEMVVMRDSEYIFDASEGIQGMYYWLMDENFRDKKKYSRSYFGHMDNFYPRYNQAALFMGNTLERQVYPLLTLQIDYKNNQVIDACLKAFKNEVQHPEYDLSDVKFPLNFKDFFEVLSARIKPQPRFLIYKDYLDDEWQYFVEKLKIEEFSKNIYDLSRLLNFLDNDQPYYGPLLEDALSQFNIPFELDKLLQDCHYRADKIVTLINMISLQGLVEKKRDKFSLLFDSHSSKRDITYQNKERRRQKMNNLIKEKKK